MVAAIIFLTVFFTLGTLLILLTHYALVAEEAHCIGKVQAASVQQDMSVQSQPHDRAA